MGTGLSYAWTFGDTTNNTATGVTPPSHTYSTIGTKTITLTVTDSLNRTATTTRTVTVS
jgi:PKD repeat protein